MTAKSGDPPGSEESPSCPSCGSAEVRRYAYGYILFENDREKQEFDRKFVIGGCTVSDRSPRFHCNTCGWNYS